MTIGSKIETAANEAGLSAEAIASKLNVSLATVRRLFKKESIDTDDLLELSKILNKPVSYFLSEILQKENSEYHTTQAGKNNAGRDFHQQKNIGVPAEGPANPNFDQNITALELKYKLCEAEKLGLLQQLALKDQLLEAKDVIINQLKK